MKLPDKVYDVLKWVVMIVIPALTAFYAVLDKTFNWGQAVTVTTISAALCACLGSILGFSTVQYNKQKQEQGSGDRNA